MGLGRRPLSSLEIILMASQLFIIELVHCSVTYLRGYPFFHYNVGGHRGAMYSSISSDRPADSAPHPLHEYITPAVSIDDVLLAGTNKCKLYRGARTHYLFRGDDIRACRSVLLHRCVRLLRIALHSGTQYSSMVSRRALVESSSILCPASSSLRSTEMLWCVSLFDKVRKASPICRP